MTINSLGYPNLELAIIRDPLTVSSETPVSNVIALMSQARGDRYDCAINSNCSDYPKDTGSIVPLVTSCVLVMENSHLLGIVTQRDIVKLTTKGKSLEGISVAEVMTRELVTLSMAEFKDIFTALNLLRQHRIRHLPILGNDGELLGIVTQTSILQVLESVKMHGLTVLQSQVSQLQTEKVELLTERTKLEQQVQQRIVKLKTQAKRERLITSIALRIRESLDLDTALSTVVEDVRYFLKVDRVLVYKFAPERGNRIVAESVTDGWTKALNSQIQDACFLFGAEEVYCQGQKQAIANIYEANLTDGIKQILEQLQVKACLVVPILMSNQLWGLLITHQCSTFREWKEDEVNLLDKIGIQLAVAIQQAELYNQARIELAERHKIEAQLRLERNFVSAVLNVAGALVVVLDEQGRIVRFNHACEQTTGYIYDQVQGKFVWDFLLVPEEIEPVKAVIQNLKKGQLRNNYENYWVTKDGDRRLISWSNNVLLNRDDQIEYIVCTGIDVTQSRKAEEELCQTRNFLQSMINNLPVAVFVKDAKPESFGRFRLWNQACERMFGLTAKQAIGKTDYDFFPKEQADFFHQKDQDAFSTGVPQDIAEEAIDSHSLGRRILHTTKVPLYDKHHQPEYLLCISEDITERKQAKEKLQQAKEQLQTVLDAVPGFVSWVSADGYYLGVNRHLAESFNLTTDAFVGQELGFMQNSPQFTDFMRDFLASPDLAASHVIDAQVKDTMRNYLLVAQKYQQNTAAVAVGIDITTRKQMEIALQQLNRELETRVEQRTLELQKSIEREKLVNVITQRIRESLDLQATLNASVAEIHKLLKVDRVLIYRIFTDGAGKVIAEAVTPGYESILEHSFPVECFPTDCYLRYAKGDIYALSDRNLRQSPSCMKQFMEDMQIRAKLVIPIIQQGVLWGLLIAHQCSHPREWKSGEIELLQQLANQLAIATKQSGLYAQLQVELNERKGAEAELRQVKERLQFLISSSPAVIFTAKPLTRNYYPTYISENVVNLVGYRAEEFLYDPNFWLNRIHPEDAPQIIENLPQILETGHHSHEYRWKHEDGEYRWMFDELKLVRDQHGNPLEIIGLWMDISDRKKAEEEIRKNLEKEKELSDLKSRFISMTSHEFRTPLAVIASSAGILKSFSHKLNEQQKQKHLQCIQTYVHHTTQLLDDILLINKAEAGKLAFEPTSVDLVSFCCTLVEELQLSAPNHTLVFSPQYLRSSLEGDNFAARMDKKLLRQILSNLLSNAVKYSPDGSKVQFNLLVQDEIAVFLIKDEGIGISSEDQQNLFESFYRASNVGNTPGTGLGLTIVKKCVELHGGRITVASEIGAGTTFRVELPLIATNTLT